MTLQMQQVVHRHYLDLKYIDMSEETKTHEKRPIYMERDP